jgi:molecular chaperone GrpE (heat shock protein)
VNETPAAAFQRMRSAPDQPTGDPGPENTQDQENAQDPDNTQDQEKTQDPLKELTTMVTGLVADFDTVMQPLVSALKRDAAFDELSNRLRQAEEGAAIGLNWTLIDGVHKLLTKTRTLNLDPQLSEMFVRELAGMLRTAGVIEFGISGEVFHPNRHDVVSAVGEGDRFLVVKVHATGLERAGAVLKRAKVTVQRSAAGAERLRQGASDK